MALWAKDSVVVSPAALSQPPKNLVVLGPVRWVGHQEGNAWERSYSQGILLSSFMNLSLSLVNMSSLLSPGPAASVEFSIVFMGSVLAVASGAIMDACLNVMVGQSFPEIQVTGHTGPCCPSVPRTAPAWAAGLHKDTSFSARGAQTQCLREVTWIPHKPWKAQLAPGFPGL